MAIRTWIVAASLLMISMAPPLAAAGVEAWAFVSCIGASTSGEMPSQCDVGEVWNGVDVGVTTGVVGVCIKDTQVSTSCSHCLICIGKLP